MGSTNRARPGGKIHGVLRVNHVGILKRVPALRGVSRDVWKDEYFVGGDIIDITEKIEQDCTGMAYGVSKCRKQRRLTHSQASKGNSVGKDHGDVHIKPEVGRRWHDDVELINTRGTIRAEVKNNRIVAPGMGQEKVWKGGNVAMSSGGNNICEEFDRSGEDDEGPVEDAMNLKG
ncbi:hypothetical protein LWI29_015589 [Acer saccharum]|uniref:Uncharacterized protein n=1 Tax=Acer saccharum TaxID=4024 RepID=A0AA39SG26_ACESA|nr:hypothetical protein LWI29_015589 [Acer saccharum]